MAEFEKYYEEEMRYLREAGREFAEAFPDKARYLNLGAVEDRDPYVERLFEGFAFLSGRIRQKLEDDFPEFTRSLMEMVAPEFLRGFPSLAMLQLDYRDGMLREPQAIPKGTVVLSNPVGPELRVCRFRTAGETRVFPMRLSKAIPLHHALHGDGVGLEFRVDEGAERGALDIRDLPLYIHGERAFACQLHHLLTARLNRLVLEAGGREHVLGGQEAVFPGGLSEKERLLPAQENAFAGGSYLQEFFAFEEKFRYARVRGLRLPALLGEEGVFRLCFYLREALPAGRRFKEENFRINVVPAVNLFETQAEPVNLNHRHFEYPLKVEAGRDDVIYDVIDVVGVDKNTGRRRRYFKFHDFRHRVLLTGDSQSDAYYQVRQEVGQGGRTGTYLSVGSHGPVERLGEEYLSVTVWATNGGLPREAVFENGICNPSPEFPASCTFANFTRPTAPLPPPRAPHYLWHVLAQMNMNFRSLCSGSNLKEALSLYDWTRSAASRKIIDGVAGARVLRRTYLVDSQPVRGSEIEVEVKDGTFSETGELHIFARVLLAYLSQYATINHLVGLRLIQIPSGRILELPPAEGLCHSI